MKKLLIAALCCGVLTFGNVDSVEAASKEVANIDQSSATEIQEVDFWSHEMRKIFGRRRNRGDDRDDYHRPPPPPPPPPSYHRHPAPPPPPPPRHQGPPPGHRPGGPPPRHHAAQDVETFQLAAHDVSE